MTMAVRCPKCGALFRVTTEQLDAHDGDVRCGRCFAVFDGLQELSLPAADAPVAGPARGARNRIEPRIRIEPEIRMDVAPAVASDQTSPPTAPAAHDPMVTPDVAPSGTSDISSRDAPDVAPAAAPDQPSSAVSDTPPVTAADAPAGTVPDTASFDDRHRDRRTPTLTEPADVKETVKPADEIAPVEPDRSVPIFARMLDTVLPGDAASHSPQAAQAKEPAAAPAAGGKSAGATTSESAPAPIPPATPAKNPPRTAPVVGPPTPGAAAAHTATLPKQMTPVVPALDPDFLSGASPQDRRRRRLWGGGALVLALLIVVQLIFLFRVGLAARYPALKPVLTGACEVFGCTVPLPQRPDQLTIESSDLRATDPAHPNRVAVSVTLRNRGAVTMGYPALDLTLTDGSDRPVARRIFMPSQYLKPDQDAHAGIAPDAEVSVRLMLDISGLDASGFRMELLPASAT